MAVGLRHCTNSCLFPLLGTANARFGTLEHRATGVWQPGVSQWICWATLSWSLTSSLLLCSPWTTFPLYHNTSTLGIKREELSKLLATLEAVKRIRPNQGKAFTVGSHSEVIPSHGEPYVGHQKAFHCCPAREQEQREQPKAPQSKSSHCSGAGFAQTHLS